MPTGQWCSAKPVAVKQMGVAPSGADDALGLGDQAVAFYLYACIDNNVRQVGGNDMQMGIRHAFPFRATSVHYRGRTADASGNLVVELRKNGSQISGTPDTIAAANQVAGHAMTGTWDFAVGDIMLPWITAVGTTPGFGLAVVVSGYRLP